MESGIESRGFPDALHWRNEAERFTFESEVGEIGGFDGGRAVVAADSQPVESCKPQPRVEVHSAPSFRE
ncbi:MAG TPA: hypothetical protein VF328_17805 [Mycobacterium sp.]